MSVESWDYRFLEMAKLVASWSKDPSTKAGAVITDRERRVLAVGYNGFARKVKDLEARYANRELKYRMVVHCETNAMLAARTPLDNCILYTYPFGSCAPCAAKVIQSGIIRTVAPICPDSIRARWGDDLEISKLMFAEALVEQVEYSFV